MAAHDPHSAVPAPAAYGTPPARTLRARVLHGLSANLLAQALNIGAQLALLPVFLVHWGAERYGQWLLLSALPGAIALADLGVSTAASNEMVLRLARGEEAGAARLQRTLLAFWLAVSAAVLIVALAVVQLAAALPWPGIDVQRMQAFRAPALCLVAYALLAILCSLLAAPLNAVRRYALGVHLATSLRAAELLVTIAAVVLSDRLDVLCAALLATRCLGVVIVAATVRRVVPWVSWRPAFAGAAAERGVLAAGLAFMAFPAVNALMNQGVLVAIGLSVDAAAVAGFAVARSLTRLVSQCLNVVIQAVQPEATHAYAGRDFELMRALGRRALRASLGLGIVACAAIVIVGPWFLTVWTHRLVAIDPVLLWIITLAQLAGCTWLAAAMTVVAANRHARMSAGLLAIAACTVAACAVAAGLGGLRAAGCVLIASEFAMARLAIGEARGVIGASGGGPLFAMPAWLARAASR